MRFNTLAAWLAWLEQAHPQEIDLGLERIRQVAGRLQLTRPQARVITVAGTNGKGSCVTTSAALLRSAGLSVGVYTSPHLLDYCERINVDGQPATEAEICSAFAAVDAVCGPVSLTYFEFGTLAALEIFRRREVDVMVLEVGLGGRLDAVNLMDSDVAVVTSVDLDHMDWLGPDRDSIGQEKAGIARAGRPLVCADSEPPAGMLVAIQRVGADCLSLGESFGFERDGQYWRWWGLDAEGERQAFSKLPVPRLPLPSVAAALQAVALLGISIGRQTLVQVLRRVSLPGRFQRFLLQGRELILDVAHNPGQPAIWPRACANCPVRGRLGRLWR
jgi:dihydrofolate synthase/folylpolyglutamate synthase